MPPALPVFSPNFIMYCLGLASYVEPMFLQRPNGVDFPLTAVIPVFNEEEHLTETIEALLNQSRRPDRIIVVDDASTDDSVGVAERFGGVEVVRNPRQIGKARSINRALSHVDTDLVMLVDADTVLEKAFVQRAMGAFAQRDVAAACGFVAPSRRSLSAAIRRARVVEDFYSQTTLKRGQDMVSGMFVVSGCCAVFRTSVLKRWGIPTETVTEDLDLTWELEREGHKTALIDAYAYTIEPGGIGQYLGQIRRWYAGFFQSLSKHGTRVLESRSLSLTLILILLECLVFTVFWAAAICVVFALPFLGAESSVLGLFLATFFTVDLVTVCFPAVIKAYGLGALRDFVYGLPMYYLMRVVNALTWWTTLVEWLFGVATPWEKSH